MSKNPFFTPHQVRDDAVPFNEVKTEHYMPALLRSIKLAKDRIAEIKKKEASFENTILALETCAEELEQISGVYFNLFSAEASEEHQALAKEVSPLMASFQSDVSLDKDLFDKIKTVYEKIDQFNLNAEDKKLVDKTYKDFYRNGALLKPAEKEKLRAMDQELSKLAPQFAENVLKSTNAFELLIDTSEELRGLPEGAVEAAAQSAQEKGHKGKWLFNLQAPSYMPFMQYADNRELRKKMWFAYNSRAFGDSYDNQELIKNLVRLRFERAVLLGYENHADFVLAERMAKSVPTVRNFLQRILLPSKKAAENDLVELQSFRKELEGFDEIRQWDFAYYSEKLKEKKYAFNEEDLRPYFQLEKVISGVFEHARRLYGLVFTEVSDVPKYHPDVKTYTVHDEETKNYVGLFYGDFFPRDTKKNGAWMTSYREQGLLAGKVRAPQVSIVCNFTKPTPTRPSLLTYDEVLTLFHEFGHSLHSLLSNCTYHSLAGTNVYWDFVELPSQIMENWVREKEGLDLFAKHYQTGEPLPAELIEKIKKAHLFQAGYASLRQISFALLDLAWHDGKMDFANVDVSEFEEQALASTQILPNVAGTSRSCSFSHIFSGGYSAGYYSYKWAEVLDADAFALFKEKGIFNKELAKKFRESILSRGGTEHPMDLYKKFRGREPDPTALLRRDGLLEVPV